MGINRNINTCQDAIAIQTKRNTTMNMTNAFTALAASINLLKSVTE